MDVENLKKIQGVGISGIINKKEYLIGNNKILNKIENIYSKEEKNIEDENINNAIIELGYKITSIKE